MSPKLVLFGNIILDSSYCIEKNPNIVAQYDFEPNGLGECSTEKLLRVLDDANKT